jgi:hypothetical protein
MLFITDKVKRKFRYKRENEMAVFGKLLLKGMILGSIYPARPNFNSRPPAAARR